MREEDFAPGLGVQLGKRVCASQLCGICVAVTAGYEMLKLLMINTTQ